MLGLLIDEGSKKMSNIQEVIRKHNKEAARSKVIAVAIFNRFWNDPYFGRGLERYVSNYVMANCDLNNPDVDEVRVVYYLRRLFDALYS